MKRFAIAVALIGLVSPLFAVGPDQVAKVKLSPAQLNIVRAAAGENFSFSFDLFYSVEQEPVVRGAKCTLKLTGDTFVVEIGKFDRFLKGLPGSASKQGKRGVSVKFISPVKEKKEKEVVKVGFMIDDKDPEMIRGFLDTEFLSIVLHPYGGERGKVTLLAIGR